MVVEDSKKYHESKLADKNMKRLNTVKNFTNTNIF